MPSILGEAPGGYQVAFDDGTSGFMPDYLAQGLVGQGMGLQLPPQQPAQPQLPSAPAAPAMPPADEQTGQAAPAPGVPTTPPVTPPTGLPPGLTALEVSGTGKFQEAPVVDKRTGIPTVERPESQMAPQVAAAQQTANTLQATGQIAADKVASAQPFLDRAAAKRTSRAAAVEQSTAEMQTAMADYEAEVSRRMSMVPQKDPNRLWNNTGSWQKVGLALGAFAAGFAGGAKGMDAFWTNMDRLIQNDLNAQETNIQTARDNVFRAERAAERGRVNILDKLRLDNEAYMERLASIEAHLKSEQARFDAPLIKQQYQEAIDKVGSELANKWNNAKQLFFTQQMQAANERSDQHHQRNMEALGWTKERREAAEYQMRLEAARAKAGADGDAKAAENRLLDPATGASWTVGKQTADKEGRIKNWSDEKQGISNYATLLKDTKQYLAKSEELGRSYGGPMANSAAVASRQLQLRADLAAMRQQIIQKFQHDNYGAALTETEARLLEKAFPPPEAITGPKSTEAIKSFVRIKAGEAQEKFINPLDVRDEATGKKVDLNKSWGTIDVPSDPKFMDASALVSSGNELAAGLNSLPTGSKREPNPAAREQVKMLTERASEVVNRAKNFASRSSMSPQVGAQAVEQLKQWSTMLTSAGFEREGDKVFKQALELEDQITSLPPEARRDKLGLPDINVR